jgi:hypothetical protein
VDLIAIRKDHSAPPLGTKRGDLFQIIQIQTKVAMQRSPRLKTESGSA